MCNFLRTISNNSGCSRPYTDIIYTAKKEVILNETFRAMTDVTYTTGIFLYNYGIRYGTMQTKVSIIVQDSFSL